MDASNTYVYTDLDELPIYNFYKCIDGKLNYLYKNKVGEITKDIVKIWEDLYNNYCEIDNNGSRQKKYRLIGEIKELELRKDIAPILFNMLLKEDFDKSIIDVLSSFKLKIDVSKQLIPQVEKHLKTLNNSTNKIKRKELELKRLSEGKKEEVNINELAIIIERNIGVKTNIFTDSVKKWLAYGVIIEKKNNG